MTITSNLINLQSLIDLSAALNASEDNSFILSTVLLSVMGKLRTFKAAALVPASNPNEAGNSELLWHCLSNKGLKIPTAPFTLQREECHVVGIEQNSVLQDAGVVVAQSVLAQSSILDESGTQTCQALLCFGEKLDKKPYTDEEQQYISLVASITANALVNAENMRSLQNTSAFLERKNQLLTTLFEINREFASLLDREEILKFLSLRLMGQLTVTKFSLLLKNGDAYFEIALNRLQITPQELDAINRHFHHADFSSPDCFALCRTLVPSCSVLIPMYSQHELKGLLFVGAKMNRQEFRAEEENFLEALAGTAMTALENARLFQEELEKKRLEEELNIARQIQQELLPTELAYIEGYDVAALNISSKQIGGDYYDLIDIGNGEMIIVIADVSGKGTPAALLMANTQAALRVLTPLNIPLPELISRLNNLLYGNTGSDKFVTLFCAKLHIQTRMLTFVNAGHNPPFLLRQNGTMELLSEGGLVLGIMETMIPYEEKTVELQHGDIILMYTDGVTEALSPESQEFTEEQTEAALRKNTSASAQSIIETVLSDVQAHADIAPQSDDITMVVLKCLPQ